MTVGIVLVSHSAELARGTAELAGQMAGEVRIEPAGGLDEPGEPLGTDAVRVAEAVQRAESGDGVLVLMDLGSAVLSGQTAVDLAEGARVELCAAPFVEGAVSAAVAAAVGSPLAAVAAEAERGLDGKQAQLGAEPGRPDRPEPQPAPDSRDADWQSVELDLTNPLGLHARPAAALVRTAGGFAADVRVTNRTTNSGPASARSLAGLIGLGAVGGHRVEVAARGPDADAALDAVRRLAADGFGDDMPAGSGAEQPPAAAPERDLPDGVSLHGYPAAGGSVVGAVRHLRVARTPDPDAAAGTPDEEAERLRAAVTEVGRELTGAADDAAASLGAQAADILGVQALLVSDEALLGAALSRVAAGTPAGAAFEAAVGDVVASYRRLGGYQGARVDDVEDVGRRVRAALAGVPVSRTVAERGVVIADALGPVDTAGLDRDLVTGVLTASGAPTGHAAILAAAMGIPAVVGAGPGVLRLAGGTQVLLDGDTGVVYVEPDDAVQRSYERHRADVRRRGQAAEAAADEPATASSGERVLVHANAGSPDDAEVAGRSGADGIGLLRTEFLFLDRAQPPTEDEQVATYRSILSRLGGRPVTIRTLDIGADKPAPYLRQAREENPFLGVRGVRLGLARPEVMLTQLRAVLRLAGEHQVRVMFPMVSGLDELDRALGLVDRARDDVGGGAHVPVGMMVEVPAVALRPDAFTSRVDFFSVGTNDLTQYVLAADRGNAAVADLQDACHPAVLELVQRAARTAARSGTGVSVCGELAGDPAVAPLLFGLGVTELSVPPSAVPAVKQAVRETSRAAANRLAEQALAATSAGEVRALLAGVRPPSP